jgi:hypothetical protein
MLKSHNTDRPSLGMRKILIMHTVTGCTPTSLFKDLLNKFVGMAIRLKIRNRRKSRDKIEVVEHVPNSLMRISMVVHQISTNRLFLEAFVGRSSHNLN